MPKIIELTVEIEIQKVSCPGVWLCQDGRVSLTVFALGTSYQTCLLPPVFPLLFKDVFYFRKRFQETCALNNICCLLKDETIFCELVQWCEDCSSGECTILAQYLGALTDVLFPPNMCSTDGVDLLMRRSKNFPGILSPKIEIATKVRIDEVWNNGVNSPPKSSPCRCAADVDWVRQRQVCHTPQYHRIKCNAANRRPRSRSRSRSSGSRSCVNLRDAEPVSCKCPNPIRSVRRSPPRPRSAARNSYQVYNVTTERNLWHAHKDGVNEDSSEDLPSVTIPSYRSRSVTKDVHTSYIQQDNTVYDTEKHNEICDQKPNTRQQKPNLQTRGRRLERTPHRQQSKTPESLYPMKDHINKEKRSSNLRQHRNCGSQKRNSLREHEGFLQNHNSSSEYRNALPKNRNNSLKDRTTCLRDPDTLQKKCNIPFQKQNTVFHEHCTFQNERKSHAQEYNIPHKSGKATQVFKVDMRGVPPWTREWDREDNYDDEQRSFENNALPTEDRYQKIQLESRYIEDGPPKPIYTYKRIDKPKLKPCICEICRKYHELFHGDEYAKC